MKNFYKYWIILIGLLLTSPGLAQSSCASIVKNIGFEKRAGNIEYVTKLNTSTALFYAEDQYYGSELWKTDGTLQGTSLVKDIAPGTSSSRNGYGYGYEISAVNKPIVLNEVMYFEANDGIHGYEIWRSDGTEKGTFMLMDLNKESGGNQQARNFFVFNDEVYFWDSSVDIFRNNDHYNGQLYRLYKSKGTVETTVLVGQVEASDDLQPGGTPMIEYKGALYFPIQDIYRNLPTGFVSEQLLYKVDKSGKISKISLETKELLLLGAANGQLYLTNQKGLYKSDGTASGTVLIRESGSVFNSSTIEGPFWEAGNITCFLTGSSLWRTDGTMIGTYVLRNSLTRDFLDLNREIVFSFKGELYFMGYSSPDNSLKGDKLWKTNGTVEGTIPVVDIDPESKGRAYIRLITEVDGSLYFSGKVEGVTADLDAKSGIWKSDGTQSGTKIFCPYGANLSCKIINPTFTDYGFLAIDKSLLFLGVPSGFVENYGDAELYRTSLTNCPSITATITGTAAFCPGGNTTLSVTAAGGTGPYTYRWLQGTTTVGSGTASLTVNTAGTYTITGTDANGCTGSSQVTIIETANLSVNITGSSTFCAGTSTNLTANVSGGTTPFVFQWKQGTANVGTNSNSYAATAAGSYAVDVADSKGCKGTSASVAVTQRPAPVTPTLTASVSAIVTGGTATLQATIGAGLSAQWLLNDTPIAGATQTSYTATQGGRYTIRVTNSDGCSATSQAVTINLITAVDEPQSGPDFQVSASPNPSQGMVEIHLTGQRGKTVSVTLSVRDLTGRSLYQKQIRVNGQHTEHLDLTQQPVGLYLLNAATDQQQSKLRLIRE